MASSEASETQEEDDPQNLHIEAHDTFFLSIPQIKAREILRARVALCNSMKVTGKSTCEDFERVIKPLLMSSVDFLTEAEADSASVRRYHGFLSSADDSLVRSQLERDGWRFAICDSVVSPGAMRDTYPKRYNESLRWICAFNQPPDPHDCFSQFIFPNFLEHAVVSATNYAARRRSKASMGMEAWQDLDINELMAWIGVLEFMQIAETSSGCVQEYWKPNAFHFGTVSIQFNFSNHMSHHRWLQILKCLSFEGDVSMLFDAFNQRVEKNIAPGQSLSVCQLPRFESNFSEYFGGWVCLFDSATGVFLRLPSGPSKTKHWSEQIRDPNTAFLLGLTQSYHFSFREALVLSPQMQIDATVELRKRGIYAMLLSDNTPCTLPQCFPADILRAAVPSASSCLVCDRTFGADNVRIVAQQNVSCAFCTEFGSTALPSRVSDSDLKEYSNSIAKIAQFQCSVEEHIKSFMRPIRQTVADSSDIENFDKMSALICIFAIIDYNAKKMFDISSNKTESPVLHFRARLASKLLSSSQRHCVEESTLLLDNHDMKKRRLAEDHRLIRLDNSTSQVQRQCSLACRCANKKSQNDPPPRTSNACSCSPSTPLCSKVCHTYHVLSHFGHSFPN
jgi:hypothetical protein